MPLGKLGLLNIVSHSLGWHLHNKLARISPLQFLMSSVRLWYSLVDKLFRFCNKCFRKIIKNWIIFYAANLLLQPGNFIKLKLIGTFPGFGTVQSYGQVTTLSQHLGDPGQVILTSPSCGLLVTRGITFTLKVIKRALTFLSSLTELETEFAPFSGIYLKKHWIINFFPLPFEI